MTKDGVQSRSECRALRTMREDMPCHRPSERTYVKLLLLLPMTKTLKNHCVNLAKTGHCILKELLRHVFSQLTFISCVASVQWLSLFVMFCV